jgi:hypothetical protein
MIPGTSLWFQTNYMKQKLLIEQHRRSVGPHRNCNGVKTELPAYVTSQAARQLVKAGNCPVDPFEIYLVAQCI